MRHLTSFMRDVDLLFSNVESISDHYFFRPMKECTLNYPVFDQRYTDTEQQIIIAATGANKKDFEINLKDDILSIKRTNSSSDDKKTKDANYTYVKRNISKKKFDIAFKIPKIWDGENLSISLENGELIITIPIKEQNKSNVKEFQIK